MNSIPWYYCNKDDPACMDISREAALARTMGTPPCGFSTLSPDMPVVPWAKQQAYSYVGIIFDPYFWYHPKLWNRWFQALEADGPDNMINVPAGTQDPSWRELVPVKPYLTLRMLEKSADFSIDSPWVTRNCSRTEGFMVALIPVALLANLPHSLIFRELPSYWAKKGQKVRIFCNGWLHAFNSVKEEGQRHDLLSMCNWKGTVLELGCGNGLMAMACKKQFPDITWIGTDINFHALQHARPFMDMAIHADISEALPFIYDKLFERIVCADILEHLPYPWETLKLLRKMIKPAGLLVASFPNIGHWSIVEDLLMGRLDETPSGILCVTHLRMGTGKNWKQWLESSGWAIEKWETEKFSMPDSWIVPSDTLRKTCNPESLETVRFRVTATPVP